MRVSLSVLARCDNWFGFRRTGDFLAFFAGLLLLTGVSPAAWALSFTKIDYTVTMPFGVAVGDFNGDNKLDLAVSSYNNSAIAILNGTGTGSFQSPISYSAGAAPKDVVIGDFDADGNPDLAVTNYTSPGGISILRNKGAAYGYAFELGASYADAGNYPWNVKIGDFNHDGKLDLVNSSNNPQVRLGNGNGTFQSPSNYSQDSATGIVVGDFNSDGNLDWAVAKFGTSYYVTVRLGNGNGTFPTIYTSSLIGQSQDIVMRDFNSDGKPDLAVTITSNSQVAVLIGNGNGTFQSTVYYSVGNSPRSIAAGDFNGDGKLDLVVGNDNGSNSIAVLLGNGNGTFQTAVNYIAGVHSYSIGVGDFNGDGKPDLAVANRSSNTVSVLLNTTMFNTTLTLSSTINPSVFGQAVTLTATISPSAVTGTVTFRDGGNIIASCENVALSNGTATCNTSALTTTGSPHSLTAVYNDNGSASYYSSTSNTVSQSVNLANTITSLALTNGTNPSVLGDSLTFTATVAATPPGSGTPSGTVTFNDGASTLCTNVILSSGSAACATGALSLGSHSLTAVYSGDTNFTGGTSAPLTHNVNQAPAITSAATATFTVGQASSFTATATGTPAPTLSYSGALPSGVSFTNGTLSGTPAAGTETTYPLVLTASNGIGSAATQNFTLTVQGSDNDLDGYRTPDDCNDNDADIHPGATEICDRQDNDCDPTTVEHCPLGCPQP